MGKYTQGMRRHTEEVVLSGKAIRFARINVFGFIEFQKWIRDDKKRRYNESVDEYAALLKRMGLDDPGTILDRLDKHLNDVSDEDVDAAVETIEGIAQLAWLCARDEQPDITPEEIKKLLDLEDIEAVIRCAFPPSFIEKIKAGDETKEPEPESEKPADSDAEKNPTTQ